MKRVEVKPAALLLAQQMMMGRFMELTLAVAAQGEMKTPAKPMRAILQQTCIAAQAIIAGEDIGRMQRAQRQRPAPLTC